MLGDREIGSVPIVYTTSADKAFYKDYLKKAAGFFLL
jgi:hypothetical protein